MPPDRWRLAIGHCAEGAGAAAGNRTLLFFRPARARTKQKLACRVPWRGPGEKREIKHLLVISRSQPAVSRRLFRCLGAHLLRSPSTVNLCQTHRTCLVATSGHTPPAENLGSPAPVFVLCRLTSSRCRLVQSHSAISFVRGGCLSRSWANKKPCYRFGKQGWKFDDSSFLFASPAYLKSIRVILGFMTHTGG